MPKGAAISQPPFFFLMQQLMHGDGEHISD
jgi:hypothetical protein